MIGAIRNWLERRVVARSTITPAQWEHAFASLPLLFGLTDDEKRRLRELTILFMHRKVFEGAHGLEVSQAMALKISLQACLPVLELGLDLYRGWTSIIVYPSGFAPLRVYQDEFGVEHIERSELAGEAWEDGPVILSWDDADQGGEVDGYNLVIHEFAHKLDMQNGESNGFPPLHPEMNADNWTGIFSAGFESFRRSCDAGVDLGISDYAASSPTEFFAVLSEVFFEQPALLDRLYPSIYAQLRLYYRQDPLARRRW